MRTQAICVIALAIFIGIAGLGETQSDSGGSKTLASTMDVYVFPNKGQDATQQSMDEAACYGWAVENTGSDPFAHL